jgi:hypothetical protein
MTVGQERKMKETGETLNNERHKRKMGHKKEIKYNMILIELKNRQKVDFSLHASSFFSLHF